MDAEDLEKNMLHHINEGGYTVDELAEQLTKAQEAGMGKRRVYVGPTSEPLALPSAIPIVGIEGTTDKDSSELDILWLYPGENEWI